ncbi:recombinase family protein [Paraburkholderia sp. A1RO-5L]|uniref:recombinase family protein n=1 Tax=unclassified Paraburkholderia TaxID=2615204 RepID=UPI003B7B539E
MRTFIYARVSTDDQTPDNQVHEIQSAGFAVEKRRIITEHISGSTPAADRPQFAKLLDRLEGGDVLIVTKLDRLGRDAMDVRKTIAHLDNIGVRVHCLALGGADLTSAAGKLTLGVLTAVAEFERDLIIERTNAGLARAKANGVKMGRPNALTEYGRRDAIKRIQAGESISAIARELKTSRATIMRLRDKTVSAQS